MPWHKQGDWRGPPNANLEWLPRKDSNLDKEIQNLWCYRYTTRQMLADDVSAFARFPQVR
jgi:hypothetical protein